MERNVDTQSAALLSNADDVPKYSVDKYCQWIQDQYLNAEDANVHRVTDSVFRVLLMFYGGRSVSDKENFLVLTNCALDYAAMIPDKLVLLSTLFDELINTQLTDSLIDPLIRVGFVDVGEV